MIVFLVFACGIESKDLWAAFSMRSLAERYVAEEAKRASFRGRTDFIIEEVEVDKEAKKWGSDPLATKVDREQTYASRLSEGVFRQE